VHGSAILLLPVVAAEKSKVPFFIAGGILAGWAIFVSIALGLRRAEFPGSLLGERVVIAISVVLVLAAVSTAVITASAPAKTGEASASGTAPSSGSAPAPAPAPAPPAPSAKKAAGKHHGGKAKATSGAPTPPPSPPGAASTIALAADPNGGLSFDKKQISAKAGSVTIAFTNSAPLEHNVTIAEGGKLLGATPTFVRGSRSVTLTLKAGTYTFYCSVPGHRQGGMEGTLSVT
jgi:plastocyanin